MSIEHTTATAPASWASYLVNGDASGIDERDQAACDAWQAMQAEDGWHVVDIERDDNGEGIAPRFMTKPMYMSHLLDWDGGDFVDYVLLREARRANP